MTLPELAAMQAHVASQKARGAKPSLAGLGDVSAGLAALTPLPALLAAEARGEGRVEFKAGFPVLVPGPPRFRR